jgi:hypothetical protein
MNELQAKILLSKIKQASEDTKPDISAPPNYRWPYSWVPNLPFTETETANLMSRIRQPQNVSAKDKANRTIFKTLLISGMLGAGTGLFNYATRPKRKKPFSRVENFKVPVKPTTDTETYKSAQDSDVKYVANDRATKPLGLDYFAPSMLLGAPLAAYGGWKGVDSYLKRRRSKAIAKQLKDAQKEYEAAILGSYKSAQDTISHLDKISNDDSYWKQFENWFNTSFPNAAGGAKGILSAYALSTFPLGYHLMSERMRGQSKRTKLHKALLERQRHQHAQQPPSLWAEHLPFNAQELDE